MRDLATLANLASAAFQSGRTPCKCCKGMASSVGAVDFNKSCEEIRGTFLAPASVPVTYFLCPDCGFLFTRFFDAWSREEFAAHIYNADYAKVDPDYLGARPAANAKAILEAFGAQGAGIRFLDWGAGAGLLARKIAEAGFQRAEAYDPYDPAGGALPEGAFNLIGCYEVMEHVTDPRATVRSISRRAEPGGMVLLTTAVRDAEALAQGLRWWYIAPRNGHVSIFSPKALSGLWLAEGWNFRSLNPYTHIAWKRTPDFAAHLPHLFAV